MGLCTRMQCMRHFFCRLPAENIANRQNVQCATIYSTCLCMNLPKTCASALADHTIVQDIEFIVATTIKSRRFLWSRCTKSKSFYSVFIVYASIIHSGTIIIYIQYSPSHYMGCDVAHANATMTIIPFRSIFCMNAVETDADRRANKGGRER